MYPKFKKVGFQLLVENGDRGNVPERFWQTVAILCVWLWHVVLTYILFNFRQVSCIPDFVIKFRRKIKLLGLDDKEWSLEPSEVAPILREGLDKLARAQWEPRKDEDKDPTKKANTSFKEFFIYKHATLFNARQVGQSSFDCASK